MSDSRLQARVVELENELSRLKQLEEVPYRTIVEDMSELVVRWKPDGTRLFVNDAYCRLFGARREDLIGTTFWPLITDEDREGVRARLDALSFEQPVSTGAHRAIAQDGSLIWMEWVDRAIYDNDHRIVELQSVGRDITARVRLEQQARSVGRGDAAARASATIAHDLRNLLLIISGFTTMIAEKSLDQTSVEVVRNAVQTADRLLTQLRNVSHGVVVEPKPVDIGERVLALRELLREMAANAVKFEERLHAGSCRILGDSTQIDQILLNLVRNAVEAMPNGGRVVLETAVATCDELAEAYRPPEAMQCAILRVIDEGPGISEGVLARIFDARITTKPAGEGLGLAIVKSIVEGHSATIRVDTSLRGTTFEIAFPLVQ